MERQGDDTFKIQIRIGIHTGDAIVEKDDVYGDIVNVAARVESVGKGNQILVSQATVAYIEDEYAFILKRKGWFIPKGKSTKFYVYACDWKNHPLLINKIINTSSLPVSRRQKIEIGLYVAATIGVLYFIYLKYLRYLVSDSEEFGWIVGVSPPQMGVPEKLVSEAYQFHFRYKDLYVFVTGFLCFIFGFWKFRMRPI